MSKQKYKAILRDAVGIESKVFEVGQLEKDIQLVMKRKSWSPGAYVTASGDLGFKTIKTRIFRYYGEAMTTKKGRVYIFEEVL